MLLIMPKITFDGLKVTYETKVGDKEIEIEGTPWKFNDGRTDVFRFTDDWFADADSEIYFDENWDTIEQEILNAYYEQLN